MSSSSSSSFISPYAKGLSHSQTNLPTSQQQQRVSTPVAAIPTTRSDTSATQRDHEMEIALATVLGFADWIPYQELAKWSGFNSRMAEFLELMEQLHGSKSFLEVSDDDHEHSEPIRVHSKSPIATGTDKIIPEHLKSGAVPKASRLPPKIRTISGVAKAPLTDDALLYGSNPVGGGTSKQLSTEESIYQDLVSSGVFPAGYKTLELNDKVHQTVKTFARELAHDELYGMEEILNLLYLNIYRQLQRRDLYPDKLKEKSKILFLMGPEGTGKRSTVKYFCRKLGYNLVILGGSISLESRVSKIHAMCDNFANGAPTLIYFDHCEIALSEGPRSAAELAKEIIYLQDHAKVGTLDRWLVIGSEHYVNTLYGPLSSRIPKDCMAPVTPPNLRSRRDLCKRNLARILQIPPNSELAASNCFQNAVDWLATHSRGHTAAQMEHFCEMSYKKTLDRMPPGTFAVMSICSDPLVPPEDVIRSIAYFDGNSHTLCNLGPEGSPYSKTINTFRKEYSRTAQQMEQSNSGAPIVRQYRPPNSFAKRQGLNSVSLPNAKRHCSSPNPLSDQSAMMGLMGAVSHEELYPMVGE